MPGAAVKRVVLGLQRAAAFAGFVVIVAGCAVLLGWSLDIAVLKSFHPGLVAMNPMTAVGFILSGALLCIPRGVASGPRGTLCVRIVAAGIMVIGLAKLSEILLGWQVGLDQVLFSDRLAAEQAFPPNRMAPNTALDFVLAGGALFLGTLRRQQGLVLSQCLALLVGLQALIAIIGYTYGVRPLYGMFSFIPMAAHTAFTFGLLSVGILLLRPEDGLVRVLTKDDAGGVMARRLLPLALGFLPMAGWLGLEGQRAGLYETEFGLCLTTLAGILVLGTVIWINANSLSGLDEQRHAVSQVLRTVNENLESRVSERTADLAASNSLLSEEISERRSTEEALQRSEHQFRQAQKMEAVGRLAGGVAHDFNNLLTAILGYSQLARARLSPNSKESQEVVEIEKAAKRGAALTGQLLAFSRPRVLQPRVMNLNDSITSMDRMVRRLLGADIDILTSPSPSLGAVRADPDQIEQVILNLVINARDAMPDGGKLTVETADVEIDEPFSRERPELHPGPYVLLAVSDNGCGMSAETRAHVFEPFYTTKESGKGTGLGLSTVHGIVKQCGGHVEVYSEPGRGTTFKVYLPRTDMEQDTLPAPRSSAGSLRGTGRILLIEDEAQVRAVILATLTSHGYDVVEAGDGQEALALFEREPDRWPDLVLTDLMTPKMSGRELVRRLAALHPGLRVLYMSGFPDKAVLHEGLIDRSMAFIQKPFTPEALLGKVSEVLDARPTVGLAGSAGAD